MRSISIAAQGWISIVTRYWNYVW